MKIVCSFKETQERETDFGQNTRGTKPVSYSSEKILLSYKNGHFFLYTVFSENEPQMFLLYSFHNSCFLFRILSSKGMVL